MNAPSISGLSFGLLQRRGWFTVTFKSSKSLIFLGHLISTLLSYYVIKYLKMNFYLSDIARKLQVFN